MPTFSQRLDFLRRADKRYLWFLLLRKLGVTRIVQQREGLRLVVPLGPPGGTQLAYMSSHLPVDLLKRLLTCVPGAFVDVGANVGLTLTWLRIADRTRPWIGFEPSPEACRFIRELIRANAFQNTRLIEAGLSDETGGKTLYAAGGTDSSASMIQDFQGENAAMQDRSYDVEVLNGADLLETELAERAGVVKIDVEGMELEVVRGLRKLIERDRPVLFIEIIPVKQDKSERATRLQTRQDELLLDLRALGYRLAQVRESSVHDVEVPGNDPRWFNYVAIHKSRWDEIRPCL